VTFGVAFAPLRFSGGIAASLPSIRSNFAESRTTMGFMHLLYAVTHWLMLAWAVVFVGVVALVFASIPVAAAAKVWLWVREVLRRARSR